MQIENISAIPTEIDTVEKLYLWCYYQLSSTNDRVEIEGEKEYLVDSELIRPDGVDPRLFLITKINLPIDENWLINGFKLWENAIEILEGAIENLRDPFESDILFWLKADDFTDSSLNNIAVRNNFGVIIDAENFKYGTGSFKFSNRYLVYYSNLFLIETSDFTVECWLYKTTTNNDGIWSWSDKSDYPSSAMRNKLDLWTVPANLRFSGINFNVNFNSFVNQWIHIAVVKQSNIVNLYLNGEKAGIDINYTTNIITPLYYVAIGMAYSSSYRLEGNIDSFRITKACRYTDNFNPETDTYLAY